MLSRTGRKKKYPLASCVRTKTSLYLEMMKNAYTYENDIDLKELVYTEITDEKILDFFFKKGGTVNIVNLQWCVSNYSNKQIAQNLLNLELAGLIYHSKYPLSKLTFKARWQKFRDLKSWTFWAAICGIIALLILLIQELKCL